MYYVYILKSKTSGKLYIGYTADLRERFRQHNDGESQATRNGRPWVLAYYESFASPADAKRRELSLKDFGKAYGQLKRRIQQSLLEC